MSFDLDICKHCGSHYACHSCVKLEDWIDERRKMDECGDLISKEALFRAWDAISREEDPNIIIDEMIKATQDAPAVDAVEVVRCKDCMYSILLRDSPLRHERPWRYYHLGCRICQCNALIEDEPITVEADFFCKYGVKMEGNK